MTFTGPHTEETKQRISLSSKGLHAGSRNGNWRGDSVSYWGIHKWLADHKERTGECELCERRPVDKNGKISTDFANVSGEYRRDVDDYIEVCRSCHRWWDSESGEARLGEQET